MTSPPISDKILSYRNRRKIIKTTSREQRFQTICLFILSSIAIAFALYWLRPVMIPFILAVFLTFVLSPIIDFQMKYLQFPRLVAFLITLIFGFFLLSIFWLLLSASITQIAANLDSYQEQINQLLLKGANALHLEERGFDTNKLVNPISKYINRDLGGLFLGSINRVVDVVSQGILVFIFVLFLLLGKTKRTKPVGKTWKEGEKQIKSYIITKVFISGATGVLVGGFLMLIGIDLALVFGLLVFLLNFIPSIGSIVATLLPLPVVLVSPNISPATAAMAIIIPGTIQFIIGNVLEPKIMGESLDLHPVVILMALIFWGMLWGVAGMLLAVPLTCVMKIILRNIEFTEPIADLLAGRLDSIQSEQNQGK